MTQNPTRRRWPIVLAILGLSYLVAVVFYPVLGFSLISLDVNRQLVDNPHVHGLSAHNIQHILSSHCIASYYPVRSLTLALDYEIWGLDRTELLRERFEAAGVQFRTCNLDDAN